MTIRTYTFLSVGASLLTALALAAGVLMTDGSANSLNLMAAGALVAVIAISGVALYASAGLNPTSEEGPPSTSRSRPPPSQNI